MIIKTNLIAFLKNNYNVNKISYRKSYTYGKGEYKETYFQVEVDGVKHGVYVRGENISAKDLINTIVREFKLEKVEHEEVKFSDKELDRIKSRFVLPLDTEDFINQVCSYAYHHNYFDGKSYSDIKDVDNLVKVIERSIKTKTIDQELIDILKKIKIEFKSTTPEVFNFLKMILKYFKFISSKPEYRLLLVATSRLHNVTSDTCYCGSNFRSHIDYAIKAVKKHKLNAEDNFKFDIYTENSRNWEQGACIGFSSISHSAWTETLYLKTFEGEFELHSMENCSAYGHY